MAIKGARPDDGRVTPHLVVRGGRNAIAFYTKAFGAISTVKEELTPEPVHARMVAAHG